MGLGWVPGWNADPGRRRPRVHISAQTNNTAAVNIKVLIGKTKLRPWAGALGGRCRLLSRVSLIYTPGGNTPDKPARTRLAGLCAPHIGPVRGSYPHSPGTAAWPGGGEGGRVWETLSAPVFGRWGMRPLCCSDPRLLKKAFPRQPHTGVQREAGFGVGETQIQVLTPSRTAVSWGKSAPFSASVYTFV